MRVIVSTGATREPIDDFRVLTNVSTGRFGYEAACAFHRLGWEVVLLGPSDLTERRWYELPFEPRPFTTVSDLAARVRAAIDEGAPDVLVMAAAVADYRPFAVVRGKLSSDTAERDVRLVRTPKIIANLRKYCGRRSFLVGMKLMSGVSIEKLREVARGQNATYELDMTVAYDLERLEPDHHRMYLATPAGDWVPLDGTRPEVAGQLARWIHDRVVSTGSR